MKQGNEPKEAPCENPICKGKRVGCAWFLYAHADWIGFGAQTRKTFAHPTLGLTLLSRVRIAGAWKSEKDFKQLH